MQVYTYIYVARPTGCKTNRGCEAPIGCLVRGHVTRRTNWLPILHPHNLGTPWGHFYEAIKIWIRSINMPRRVQTGSDIICRNTIAQHGHREWGRGGVGIEHPKLEHIRWRRREKKPPACNHVYSSSVYWNRIIQKTLTTLRALLPVTIMYKHYYKICVCNQ